MKSEIPQYNFVFAPNNREIKLTSLKSGKVQNHFSKFFWNLDKDTTALFKRTPMRLSDLAEIAGSVFLADRMGLRLSAWKRKMHLTIPVSELSFWNDSMISEVLSEVLYHFTEDEWSFGFIAKESKSLDNSGEQIDIPFDMPEDTFVALFSGGLDSFAGVVNRLSKVGAKKCFLVSIVTNPCRMRGAQRELVRILKGSFNVDIIHIPLVVYLRRPKLPEHLQEKTQRTRGFIFSVLGSIFSAVADQNVLNLFENGIGAINLPMVDFQIGTDNTRSVNPSTLTKISKLISLITEKSFEVNNLAQWLTKAQLCQALLESPLKNTIKRTVSCDGGFSRRVKWKTHCGYCTSCLLRRQALCEAGLLTKDATYEFDIFQNRSIQEKKRLLPLRAMQSQVKRLDKYLRAENPWFELSKNFPLLEEIKIEMSNLDENEMFLIQNKILRLYSDYVKEWHNFTQHLK